jgi:GDP-L-fucose synthase
MPTNLYGPHDNFDLEKSHVLPALLRKIHLAKLLHEKKYDAVVADLDVKDIDEAREYLQGFGVDEKSVEIWGSGKPRREFLYSEDMADACVFLLQNRDFKDTYESEAQVIQVKDSGCAPLGTLNIPSEVRNTHINIGTGVDISIRELALTIKKIVGYEGELYFNDTKPDGTMVKLTDPSKLHDLGWRHKVELDRGIDMVYRWYLEHNND